MKVYLIDPIQRTVEQVEYNGTPEQLRELIGCRYFEAHRINELGDHVFVDEEAGLRPGNILPAFRHKNWRIPLIGRGVVIGLGKGGKEREPRCALESMQQDMRYGALVPAPDQIAEALVTLMSEPPSNEVH